MEIPKTYDPKQAEREHYARWEAEGYFAPETNRDPAAPVFSIAIPPPNVTGSLHLGREKFVERVWQWKHESGGQILNQMRREGASVDWSRERFTMDEGLSRAVREVFV